MKKVKAGDILTSYLNEKHYLIKIVEIDEDNDIYHISMYGPFDTKPDNKPENFDNIFSLHVPVTNLKLEKVLGNVPVTGEELKAYNEFLKITNFKKYVEINNLKVEDIANDANEQFRIGNEKYEEGNFNDAIYYYSNALNIYPGFSEAADNRGLARMAIGELNEAIKDFEFSIMINQDSHVAYFCIGECYYHLGNMEKAKEYLEKSLDIKPDDEITLEFLTKVENSN